MLKRIASIFLLLCTSVAYGQDVLSVSRAAGQGAQFVCSCQEEGCDKALDFLFITPKSAGETSFKIRRNSIKFLFTFPEGEDAAIMMNVPATSETVHGKLTFIRAGVPDGDRKFGVVWNDAGGRRSKVCFDFYTSEAYDWQTAEDDGGYELVFKKLGKNNSVQLTIILSED